MLAEQEAELVQRVAGGDRAAFRVLLEQHQRPLSAYARRMLGEADGANDVVQETFLRLWTEAARFDGSKARLTTWLHNIARNLCIDSFRKGSRINYSDEPGTIEDDRSGPQQSRESAEQQAALRAAIAALPERQRTALLLCHYQGFSNQAAAQVLDVSVDALESLLARARRSLKKELLHHDES